MPTVHYPPTSVAGAGFVEYPNQPTKHLTADSWEYVYRKWTTPANAMLVSEGGAIPPLDTIAIINGSTFYLAKVDVEETDTPERVNVTFTYNTLGSSSWQKEPEPKENDIEQRTEPTSREITTTNAYTGGATFSAEALAAMGYGQKTVSVGGLKYEYAAYKSSFTWSEANLVAVSGIGVGKLGAPTGIIGPTAFKWKFHGKQIERHGNLTKITEHWEYSPVDWPH